MVVMVVHTFYPMLESVVGDVVLYMFKTNVFYLASTRLA